MQFFGKAKNFPFSKKSSRLHRQQLMVPQFWAVQLLTAHRHGLVAAFSRGLFVDPAQHIPLQERSLNLACKRPLLRRIKKENLF